MWSQLYDILISVSINQSAESKNAAEFKAMKLKIVKILYRSLEKEPSRVVQLEVDKEFLEGLQFPTMLKSTSKEERTIASDFCILLLHQEPKVTVTDLIQYDMESRDLLSKAEMVQVWKSINSIGTGGGGGVQNNATQSSSVNKDIERTLKQFRQEIDSFIE